MLSSTLFLFYMEDFKQRFEIIYKKFADWGIQNGFKPSKLAFSRFIGVFQATMQRWEKGQLPSGKDLKTIHDKLGFSYDWLISGEGEMLDSAAKKLAEQEAEIARLRTKLLMQGDPDEKSSAATAKAAGQE